MEDLEKFQAATQRLLRRYNEVEVRSAVIRNKSGSWILAGLYARATNSSTVSGKPPNVDDARFEVQRIPTNDLVEFARTWKDGHGSIEGLQVSMPRPGQPKGQPSFRHYREMQRTVDSVGVPDWSAETYSTDSGTRGEVEDYGRHIDDQLFASTVPWEGLIDVQQRFLMHKNANDPHDGWFRICIPYPARLTLANTITKDTANIEVEFLPNNVMEGFQLACVADHDDGSTSRLTLALADVPLEGGRRTYAFALDQRPIFLRVGLFVDGVRVHSWRWESFAAFGASARLAALGLTEEQESFVDRLRKGGGGRGFEGEVSLAFHLAGFSPGWYGAKGKEADIVVFPDYGHYAFVVECTQGGADLVSKLKKLAVRTQMLKGRFDGAALPVLVCRQSSDIRTQSVQESASQDGVALMTPDDCVDMIELATHGASTREICRLIEDRVPRHGALAPSDWSRAQSSPRP